MKKIFLVSLAVFLCCGCNIMSLSQNQRVYAQANQYRYLAEKSAAAAKNSIKDPLVLDRAQTLYAQTARAGNALLEALQRMAKDNRLADDLYGRDQDLSGAYADFVLFIEQIEQDLKVTGMRADVLQEVEAQKQGKESLRKIKAVLSDRSIPKKERAIALVSELEKNRWLDWPDL